MDALIGVAVECVKCAIPPFVRQMGYCVHSKKFVEKLARKVEDLKNMRTDVQNRVTAAKKNLESINKVVEAWLERVDMETNNLDVTMMGVGSMNGDAVAEMANHQLWCCCPARYSIGKQAQKKIVSIDDLINEGKSFVDISYPSSLLGLELMPITADIFDFASRESTRNQVMAALKEEGTYLVGIYGMGGIGKTTLMNQVAKQVKEEKIFDAVVITIVSQNIEVKRIQGEIANQLGLRQLQEVDDKFMRAAMLSERIKQEKRVLVILDDLWTTSLDLSDVGIPCGDNHLKGCKVVVTTRSLEVCNSLLSQKNIEVGALSEEESWHLFKKNVGDVVDSPALQTVSREVVKECCGLPIALVTLGRALRNKDKLVWDDTSLQLRRSDFTYIEGMNSKVVSSIKLSYDHLGNEILKKCFLFCCLFPEDYRIEIEKLLMYVMSDDMILEDLETLKQVRGRLQIVLDKLIASCLLLLVRKEEDGVISRVRMHDVVRDVAISIASEEVHRIFVKAGLSLKSWPERARLLSVIGKCLRLSLMGNEISVLPDQPELPNLLSLSLEGNHSLKKLPDNVFQSMEALVALDISKTGISSLPSSLSFLVNLRSLHLRHCDLHETDISVIGKLKKLEILNLSWCKLSSLPEEIGGLPNLRLLDLSKNHQLNFIPPNEISRLSRLEELYMLDSFKKWKVEPTEDGSRASLDEVASLISSLKSVQLEVYNDEIMARISTDRVFRYKHLRDLNLFDHNNFGTRLTAPSPICYSIRVMLAIIDDLMLSDCTGLKSVGQLVIGDGFNNMKILAVKECDEMEYLISVVEEKIPTTTFIALEKLYLRGLFNLKEIFHGPMPAGFLDRLEQVYVENCQNLVSIFSPDVWVKLNNLQRLRVVDCRKLKKIFYLKEEEGCRLNKHDGHVDVTFPKLKELYLKSLPELTIIWKGVFPIESFQYLKVMQVTGCHGLRYLFSTPAMVLSLQQLEELKISFCDGMAGIATPPEEMVQKDQVLIPLDTSNALPPQIFPNLRELVISECNSLKDPYPLTKLSHGGLSQLRQLEVQNCENLEEIFLNNTDEEEDHDGKAMLPQLENLSLGNLPSLKTIWKGNIPIGSLQNLRKVIIRNSDSLKHLIPVSLVLEGGLSQLQILKVENCENLEEIFLINTYEEEDHDGKALLPQLENLSLGNLPNLKTIWKGNIPIGSLQNLRKVILRNSDRLKHLIPISLVLEGALSQLQILKVKNCKNLEEIFLVNTDEEEDHYGKAILPQLEKLSLQNLPSLIWNIPIGRLQNLRDVSISNCSDSLKHLIFSVSLVLGGGLSQLRLLKVKNCKNLEEIFLINSDEKEDHDVKGIITNGSFQNLEELIVKRCNNMKHILPIRLLVNGGLPKLKQIRVEECNEMEVIFNEDGGEHDQYNHSSKMVVAFPHVIYLRLVSLPKLSKFHHGPPILYWPSLLFLDVIRCENLKSLAFNHHHSLPELKLIVGDSERWFDEELEWEDESFKSRLRHLFMNIENDEECEDEEEFESEDEEEYFTLFMNIESKSEDEEEYSDNEDEEEYSESE